VIKTIGKGKYRRRGENQMRKCWEFKFSDPGIIRVTEFSKLFENVNILRTNFEPSQILHHEHFKNKNDPCRHIRCEKE
jgi:hypothetical protein